MIQIVVPRKNNEEELFYGEEKGFRKTKSGKYYYKNIVNTSPENIEKFKNKFKNISFSLFFVEKGGAFPNDEESFAQIICDYEGGKIFPIKKIREGNRANRIHAWFLGNDLCVVNAYMDKINYIDKPFEPITDESLKSELDMRKRYSFCILIQ